MENWAAGVSSLRSHKVMECETVDRDFVLVYIDIGEVLRQ